MAYTLGVNCIVYWQYPNGKGWVFYPHTMNSKKGCAVFFHAVCCWVGPRNQLVAQYHTEPLAFEERLVGGLTLGPSKRTNIARIEYMFSDDEEMESEWEQLMEGGAEGGRAEDEAGPSTA